MPSYGTVLESKTLVTAKRGSEAEKPFVGFARGLCTP